MFTFSTTYTTRENRHLPAGNRIRICRTDNVSYTIRPSGGGSSIGHLCFRSFCSVKTYLGFRKGNPPSAPRPVPKTHMHTHTHTAVIIRRPPDFSCICLLEASEPDSEYANQKSDIRSTPRSSEFHPDVCILLNHGFLLQPLNSDELGVEASISVLPLVGERFGEAKYFQSSRRKGAIGVQAQMQNVNDACMTGQSARRNLVRLHDCREPSFLYYVLLASVLTPGDPLPSCLPGPGSISQSVTTGLP